MRGTAEPCLITVVCSWKFECHPQPLSINVTTVEQLNTDAVHQQCRHADCILSFLEDYKIFVDETSSAIANPAQDSCAASHTSATASNVRVSLYETYRQCRQEWFSDEECWLDEDCSIAINSSHTSNFTCDVLRHQCLVPVNLREKMFIKCLLESMDKQQVRWVFYSFRLFRLFVCPIHCL